MTTAPRSLVLFLCLLLACGGDSNSPNERTLAGTWSYRVDGMANSAYAGSCAIAPTTLTLAQTGDSVLGTMGSSYFICTPAAGTPDTIAIIPAGIAVRGEAVEGDLTFEIDGDYWTHVGNYFRDDMGGIASLTTQVQAQTLEFVGGWESHR